jgi:hypothetical protein
LSSVVSSVYRYGVFEVDGRTGELTKGSLSTVPAPRLILNLRLEVVELHVQNE